MRIFLSIMIACVLSPALWGVGAEGGRFAEPAADDPFSIFGPTVPNVVGWKEDAAITELWDEGLRFSLTYQPSRTVQDGMVISQNPGAGTLVTNPGTTEVALVVSSGPNPSALPSGPPAKTVRASGTGITLNSTPACLASGGLAASANPLSFPNPIIGIPAVEALTIANPTCNTISITSINVTGTNAGDFTPTTACTALLATAQSCTVNVQFIPSVEAAQPESAALNFGTSVNGVAGGFSVNLTGNATAPYAQYSAGELDFGNQPPGVTSPPQMLTLTNNPAAATAPLVVYDAAITSSSYYASTLTCSLDGVSTPETSTDPYPLTLNPGDSCTWTITYTNSGASPLPSGLLSVLDNALPSSLTSTNVGVLAGVASGPAYNQQVCLAPAAGGCSQVPTPQQFAANGFGSTISNPNQDMTTQLTNFYLLAAQSSQSALQVAQVAQNVAQFSTAAATANTTANTFNGMASPAACSIGVQFTPLGAGARNATLEIFDNSSAGVELIPLSGIGLAPPLVASQFIPTSATLFFQNQLLSGSTGSSSVVVNGARRSTGFLSAPQQSSGGTATTQSLVLTNSGTAAASLNLSILGSGDFTETDDCNAPISPGQTCTANISFAPVQSGTRLAELVSTDVSGKVTVLAPLVGSGTAVTISPVAVSFDNQMVSTTGGTQTITVSSLASNPQPLNISSLALSGDGTAAAAPGDFSITPDSTCNASTPLSAGTSCTVVVSFTPSAEGTRDAVLLLSDNGGASPQYVTLTGTGIEAIAGLSPSSLNFSPQVVGTGSTQTVTLSNTGNEALSIAGMTASGGFTFGSNCGTTVMPGGNCDISLSFNPRGPGMYNGTFSISDNGPGSPQTVALSGTGVVFTVGPNPPVIEPPPTTPQPGEPGNPGSGGAGSGPKGAPGRQVLPSHAGLTPLAPAATTVSPAVASAAPAVKFSSSSLVFPAQLVGTSSGVQTITLTNSSDAPLVITSIKTSEDFSQTNDCGESVAAGGSCTIIVTFKPSATGARAGKLTITGSQNGAAGSTQTMSLNGIGKSLAGEPSPTVSRP